MATARNTAFPPLPTADFSARAFAAVGNRVVDSALRYFRVAAVRFDAFIVAVIVAVAPDGMIPFQT